MNSGGPPERRSLACVLVVVASTRAAEQSVAGERYPATWPQVISIKWVNAEEGEKCPANAVVRCSPEGRCELTAGDGLGTVILNGGESVFVSVEYEFTKVDGQVSSSVLHTG